MHRKRRLAPVLALTLFTAFLPLTQGVAGAANDQAVFSGPEGMVLSGTHLWVVDSSANAITELNASNGSLFRVIQSPVDHFDDPVGIATSDGYLWVVNTAGHSVTQLNASNGSLVRVIDSAKYHFYSPSAITFGDAHLWITSDGNATHDASIIELNPISGALVHITYSKYLYGPYGITTHGADLWLTNQQSNAVTEFKTSNGSLVRLINAPSYQFDEPYGIQSAGNDLWVSNGEGRYPMTEINASTGSLVRVVKATEAWSANPSHNSTGTGPWNIVVEGSHVWIANTSNLVEINATSGALMRVVSTVADDFDFTQNVITDGSHLWASSFESSTVVELSASSGTLERLIR